MFNHFNTPFQGMQLIPRGFHHILIHNLPKCPQTAVDYPRNHPWISPRPARMMINNCNKSV